MSRYDFFVSLGVILLIILATPFVLGAVLFVVNGWLLMVDLCWKTLAGFFL